jgi:hypothetical protein
MSSEHLASAQTELKGDLGASWNILDGASANYTDLGIARRFGGSAAAYSLRDVGAMNGPVVNVRREPEDTTAAIDDEAKFSANQVQSGALEDWVNGKLESTLPADVATAAAAYSLRKVKATYSGDAVRIRRSSDDIEVDVAFDSDDKVSASSAITNVSEQGGESGSTTATTLGDFLNESNVNVGMGTNFFAQYPQVNVTGTSPTGFTATVAKTTTQDVDIRAGNQVYKNVQKGTITVSFNVQQNTFSNTVSVSLWQLVHGDGYKVIGTIPASSTGAFSFTFENTDAVSGAIFRFSTPDHLVNDGEVLQVSDITIKASKHTALVHTWYDQAGSNNATQATDANQPKIAESGALITKRGQPSLKFRGTDSTPIYLDSPANITANFSFFIAAQPAADGTTFGSAGNEKRNHTLWSQSGTFHMAGINSDFTNGFRHGNTILSYSAGLDFNTNLNLHSLTNGSSNVDYFGNAVNKINTTNSTSTATSYDIGRKVNITSHNTRGYISEFIHYNSDQSANRFKIESNINNYYGLYNDANEASDVFQGVNYSVTNATKTGFTIDVVTATGVGILPLVDGPDANETIYVSYNLTINSGSPSINVVTQDRSGSTNTTSADFIITTAGFYAHAITPTQDGATHLSFADDADNVNFTISNLKVSRIARNGFVERLYDQSGNGRDMAQTTASDQPHIVENGSICRDSTNNPTVKYVNVGTNLGSTFLSTTAGAISSGETSLCYLTVASISTNVPTRQTFNGAGTDFSLGGTNLRLRYNGSANTFTTSNLAMSLNTNHLVVASVNSSKICTLHLDDNSETDTSAFTANATTLNQFLGENSSSANNDNLGLQGTMSEMILYLGDKTNDISDLQNDINNFYNI